MKIIADINKGNLIIGDEIFKISNRIRTLREGTRPRSQVIRSIPDGLPYDPQPFPKSVWNVYAVQWQTDETKKISNFDYDEYGPVKIRTDAWCMVNVWELDQDGDYLRATDKKVKDTAYLLHWTKYNTTLGCIKIERVQDAVTIGKIIERALNSGEKVQIEVI